MPNPRPKIDQIKATQFQGLSGHRVTRPMRVRLPLDLAAQWEALDLEQRSALVAQTLKSLATVEDLTP